MVSRAKKGGGLKFVQVSNQKLQGVMNPYQNIYRVRFNIFILCINFPREIGKALNLNKIKVKHIEFMVKMCYTSAI